MLADRKAAVGQEVFKGGNKKKKKESVCPPDWGEKKVFDGKLVALRAGRKQKDGKTENGGGGDAGGKTNTSVVNRLADEKIHSCQTKIRADDNEWKKTDLQGQRLAGGSKMLALAPKRKTQKRAPESQIIFMSTTPKDGRTSVARPIP